MLQEYMDSSSLTVTTVAVAPLPRPTEQQKSEFYQTPQKKILEDRNRKVVENKSADRVFSKLTHIADN
jgi:hypothetical protein